ncbi:MAG: hypothetical protein HWN65_11340 [Candidatus Helarchaeota archaeon]|nr:hypothetical protein [Candidatus Helarchaeota archaeon]
MSFSPINEIAVDMHKKMEKILSPSPAICIANATGEVLYFDEGLADRLDYIQEYVKINFGLIEEGQYSFPISGTLLGFFKMSSNLMFVLFGEVGKIGKLLLFRGLLENYRQKVDELYEDMQKLEMLERSANLILKLTKKPDLTGPSFIEKIQPPEEAVTAPRRIEIGGAVPAASLGESIPSMDDADTYPELMERYRNKKFNFMEGIILQYCNGKFSLNEVTEKSKYSKGEVIEIIDKYKEKGWLVAHRKRGGKTLDKLIDAISTTQEELSVESQQLAESAAVEAAAAPEGPPTILPELLEKYRNKKFNFKEGLILQFCDGKTPVDEIVKKSNFSEEEVLEVINTYQKKEWLIIHT